MEESGLFRAVKEGEGKPSPGVLHVLGMDIGISTGYAYIVHDCSIGSTLYYNVGTTDKAIVMNAVYKFVKPGGYVIVEKMPVKMDTHLSSIYTRFLTGLERKGVKPIMKLPAEWKPMAKARGWKLSIAKTQHEEDAYNLVRYHIFTKYKIDIGDIK